MRTIAVVTGSRADYGQLVPLMRAIASDPELRLSLIATGSHLSKQFGYTVDLIKKDGFTVNTEVDLKLSGDSPDEIARATGEGVIGLGKIFSERRPDILLILGDRYEIFAAAIAALPFKIPVAHIHGGELTVGAIDDSIRHAVTKLSHLHFVACEEYRKRVIQLGEDPNRVIVSGAPTLDNLRTCKFLTKEQLTDRFGISFNPAPLLVTYHPVTLEYDQTEKQIDELLKALQDVGLPVVFSMPNADTGNKIIRERLQQYVATHSNSICVESFGLDAYWSMMRYTAAMVGNSSSGIVEAPSLGLPVVNIGSRQQARVRATNVIDAEVTHAAILNAIHKAVTPAFREQLKGIKNPYGDGIATRTIVAHLKSQKLGDDLVKKIFFKQ